MNFLPNLFLVKVCRQTKTSLDASIVTFRETCFLDRLKINIARLTDEEVFHALWIRRQRLIHLRSQLIKTYKWSVKDIRLTGLSKIESVITSTAFGLESLTEFLSRPRIHSNGTWHPPAMTGERYPPVQDIA